MSERLTCCIAVASDECLPDDAHPFWAEIDGLADEIAASLKARGVIADTFSHATGNGSQLTISSDTPSGVMYFWIELPDDTTLRAQWLSMSLKHLNRAHSAFPDGDWEVRIGDRALLWRDGAFLDEP